MADADTILIIGAGQAGAVAAATLRELGHEGAITLVGQEAHAPYERPPLSGCAADGRCAWSHLRASRGLLRTPAHHAADGHRGRAHRRRPPHCPTGRRPRSALQPLPAGDRRAGARTAGLPRGARRALHPHAGRRRALRAASRPRHASPSSAAASWAWKWRPPRVRWGPKSPSWKARRACWSACCPRHCRTGWPNAPATPAWTCAWARALPAATASRKRTPPSGARRAFITLQDAGTVAADIVVVAIGLTPEVSLAVQAGLALDPPTAASR